MTKEEAYKIMELIHAAIQAYDARNSSDGGLSEANRLHDIFIQLLAMIDKSALGEKE